MAEEEADCCPLCMEELDLTDKTFNACACGYQVCLWCWHQIKNEYNGLCPACRAPYSELAKQKGVIDREDVVRRTKQRKQKERSEKKANMAPKVQPVNRRNLANVRVMQRNLVYVIGLPYHYADDELLRSQECFGQYGRIVKAVVNKSHMNSERNGSTASAYITFQNKADAQNCIDLIDGYILDGSLLRASFGTTKYCNFFLRNLVCNNPECLYLHELGETDDSFTKEEMATDFVAGKGCFRDLTGYDDRRGSTFPPLSQLNIGVAIEAAKAPTASSDAQRKAQSAAAVYKLKSLAPENRPKSPQQAPATAPTSMSPKEEQPKGRATDDSSRNASPSSSATSSVASPPKEAIAPQAKPSLYVDTSQSPTKQDPNSTPLWSQPFPQMQPSPTEPERPISHVFSPFGMGFDGGIHRNTQQSQEQDNRKGPEAPSNGHVSAWNFEAAPQPESQQCFEYASVDAAFTSRNESSEALAGLLGVKLSAKPLIPMSIGGPPKAAGRGSRFSFANKSEPGAPPAEYSPFGFENPPPPGPFGFHQPHPAEPQYPRHEMPPASSDSASGLAFLQQMLPNVNISYSRNPAPEGYSPFGFEAKQPAMGNAWNQDFRSQADSTPFWSTQPRFDAPNGFHDPAIVNQGAPYTYYREEQERSKMQFAYRS